MTALVVVLGVAVAILAVLVAGLLRSHADIRRALHALGITEDDLDNPDRRTHGSLRTRQGVPGPRRIEGSGQDISGVTPGGKAAGATVVSTRHTTLLAFLSSSCLTCRGFWEAFSTDLELPGTDTRLVVVTQGPESESAKKVAGLAPHDITVLMSSQAWTGYAIPVSPYFMLIDGPSGQIIGKGAASTWESVVGLLQRSMTDADHDLDAAGSKPADPQLDLKPEEESSQ